MSRYSRALSPPGRRMPPERSSTGNISYTSQDSYSGRSNRDSFAQPTRSSTDRVVPISSETYVNGVPVSSTRNTSVYDVPYGGTRRTYTEPAETSHHRNSIQSSSASRPAIHNGPIERPASPASRSNKSREVYATPVSSVAPRREHKRVYSIDDRLPRAIESTERDRERKRDDTDRGDSTSSSQKPSRRGYHLSGPSARTSQVRDSDDYEYTDARGMYADTEPKNRARRGSVDAVSRDRPSMVETYTPRNSARDSYTGPPPVTRQLERLTDNGIGRHSSLRETVRSPPRHRGNSYESFNGDDTYRIPARTSATRPESAYLPDKRDRISPPRDDYDDRRASKDMRLFEDKDVALRGFGIRTDSMDDYDDDYSRRPHPPPESKISRREYPIEPVPIREDKRNGEYRDADKAPLRDVHRENPRDIDSARASERDFLREREPTREREVLRERDRAYVPRERDVPYEKDRDYEPDRRSTRERDPPRHHDREPYPEDDLMPRETVREKRPEREYEPDRRDRDAEERSHRVKHGEKDREPSRRDRDFDDRHTREKRAEREYEPKPRERESDERISHQVNGHTPGVGTALAAGAAALGVGELLHKKDRTHEEEPDENRDIPRTRERRTRDEDSTDERDEPRPRERRHRKSPPSDQEEEPVRERHYDAKPVAVEKTRSHEDDDISGSLDPDEEYRRRIQQEAERTTQPQPALASASAPTRSLPDSREAFNDPFHPQTPHHVDENDSDISPDEDAHHAMTRYKPQENKDLALVPVKDDSSDTSASRESRVRIVEPEEKKAAPKGILRRPTEKFPEDPNPLREGVAPHKDDEKKKAMGNQKWTKIKRELVNPAALTEAGERFEEREDHVIILRVLTKDEVQVLADRTVEIRDERYRERHGGASDDRDDRHGHRGHHEHGERRHRHRHRDHENDGANSSSSDKERDRDRERERERRH